MLRPSKFVDGDERLFLANTRKFEEQYGIPVKVEQESWEDLRPELAVAANVGSGPDVALAWQEDPHLFPTKTVRLNDLANYLGAKYGGWFPVAEHYDRDDAGDWIAMPVGGAGSAMVSRMSWLNEAGFDGVPEDFSGFLELATALKQTGHPMGCALGNAVGDGGWTDWVPLGLRLGADRPRGQGGPAPGGALFREGVSVGRGRASACRRCGRDRSSRAADSACPDAGEPGPGSGRDVH